MLHINAYLVLSAVESEREETHQLFLENNESIQVISTKHTAGNQIILMYRNIHTIIS
jgi:hypothetical protein